MKKLMTTQRDRAFADPERKAPTLLVPSHKGTTLWVDPKIAFGQRFVSVKFIGGGDGKQPVCYREGAQNMITVLADGVTGFTLPVECVRTLTIEDVAEQADHEIKGGAR